MNVSDEGHKPDKHQVPGQFLGYGLQYTRMLLLLLECQSTAVVSLEVFEDVGVQTSGFTTASQVKSSTSKNPVGNRAEPFWKTLSNWLRAIGTRQLSLANTIFELYVFGDFEGEICTLFSEARSDSEAQEALSKAEKLLQSDQEYLPPHITEVLHGDRQQLISLIARFRYRHGSGASIDDVKQEFAKGFVPSEFLENAVTYALGWVKKRADSSIEKGEPAVAKPDTSTITCKNS